MSEKHITIRIKASDNFHDVIERYNNALKAAETLEVLKLHPIKPLNRVGRLMFRLQVWAIILRYKFTRRG